MEEKRSESRHKGAFVGGYFSDEHMEKIAAVERLYDQDYGDPGRNRSRALRYIIECFNTEWLKNFPKSPAPAGKNAQAEAMSN
jgi:hypothetical protein